MKLIIDVPEKDYNKMCRGELVDTILVAIKNGIPVNINTLADMIINERIYGDCKQDICYEKPVIEDVKCRLELSIIDRRPCYCGADLREVWRDDISERQSVEQEKWTNFAEELKDVFEDEEE